MIPNRTGDVGGDEFVDIELAANEGPQPGDGPNGPSLGETVEISVLPGMPMPELGGVGDAVDREQVFEALFESSYETMAIPMGRYVVQGTLGRGAMGTVLKGFDPALDRRVAIKVLHAELDERHTVRLRREAQALAKLSHPNVVQVYEVSEFEGQAFVVMERVKGQTLDEWMKQSVRPGWRECVEVFLQVGAGLAAAHERGLVHRDFKPSNAIIDRKGRPRVLDFGLARQSTDFQDEQSTTGRMPSDESDPLPLDAAVTGHGTVLGTPAYMAPEQMRGEEADCRSDQFSFCVALHEAIYGERPFAGTSMAALMVSMLRGRVRRAPRGVRVPGAVRAALLRGLSKDAQQRWPSMDALLEELRRQLVPRRRPWLTLLVGVVIGLATMAGWIWLDGTPSECRAVGQLDGIWDDARRGSVESYAARSKFDEYAAHWEDQYTEVCETHEEFNALPIEDMSVLNDCLTDRKVSFGNAVTRAVVMGDDDGAKGMIAALWQRPRCLDESWSGAEGALLVER